VKAITNSPPRCMIMITSLPCARTYQIYAIWGDLGFFILILSLGYVAMQQVYASELRLSSIENELAIARQLQFAILPTTTPQLRNLHIAAAYEPMTAVAGDFYEYLRWTITAPASWSPTSPGTACRLPS
jgi:hypothetical protein